MFNPRNINSDKGITLTILVITIVVILILSGVTITAVMGDQGLINKSEELSNNTNETINQQTEELNNMINELDEIMNPWVQNKTVVTKKLKSGTKTYNVGDDYTYDCGVEGYTGGWKVLGAENGKLLIMSTVDVGNLPLGGMNGTGSLYPDGYINGIEKLNEMCASYGKNARSITVEDINRVTGYTPKHQTISITSENKYYYDNDTANQSPTATGTEAAYAGTHGLATALGITDGRPVTEKAYYYYYPNTLSDSGTTATVGIETTSKAYKLLFRNADDSGYCDYWLASRVIFVGSIDAGLGMRNVNYDGTVNYTLLYSTRGSGSMDGYWPVRAVVPVD